MPPLVTLFRPNLQIAREKDSVVFVDVRNPSEIDETGKVTDKAINIPFSHVDEAFDLSPEDFESRFGIPKPSKDQKILMNCGKGGRSSRACEVLSGKGYSNVMNLDGGYSAFAGKA